MPGLTDKLPTINPINPDAGTLSNFLLCQENFENVNVFLTNMSEYIVELIGSAVIDDIKEDVIDNLQKMKHRISYNATRDIGLPENQNGYVWCKVNDTTIQIFKDGVQNWDTRFLMFQVQTSQHHVIYPIINKEQLSQCSAYESYIGVNIEFSDPIEESGYILFF